jgi:hypothetical protein
MMTEISPAANSKIVLLDFGRSKARLVIVQTMPFANGLNYCFSAAKRQRFRSEALR